MPGRWYAVSATVHGADHEQQWNTTWDVRTAPDASGTLIAYVVSGNDGKILVSPGETVTKTWTFQAPENGAGYRFWAGQTAAYNQTAHLGQIVYLDDFRLTDVTDIYPRYLAAEAAAAAAKSAADAAMAEAKAKASMAEVQAAITVSANGKNAITVSADAPSGSGVVVGDTWWQVDAAGDIYGQWSWNGSQWTAREVRSEVIANLDVGKLTVTGESRFTSAVVDRLYADIFTAHKITAEQIVIAALDEDGNLAPGSVGAITLQNGVVGADKIIADEVAVAVADLVKARVENLVVTDGAEINDAVIVKLASEMITAGVLRTAESGQRVVIDGNGIVMYGVDPDGVEFELVRIGPNGDNLITSGDTTISPAGVQAPSGTFDDLTVGGESLGAILDALPRGLVAWGNLTSNSAWDSDTVLRARRGELQTVLQPNRTYRVSMSAHFVETSASAAQVIESLYYSFDGTPIPRGTSTGNFYRGTYNRSYLYGNNIYATPSQEFMVNTDGWTSARTFWVMYFIEPQSPSWPVRLVARNDYPATLAVEDLGPSMASTLKRWNDNNGGEIQDPTPQIQRYVKTYPSNGFETYNYNGSNANANEVVQGLYAGGPSNSRRRGGWTFPSMTGDLAGSTVEKIEVYLYMNHSFYTAGATVNPAVWSGSIKDGLKSFTQVTNWKRNTGKWFTLPSSYHAAFKSGANKGIGVIPTNGFAEQYARFNASGAKIRVTYTK